MRVLTGLACLLLWPAVLPAQAPYGQPVTSLRIEGDAPAALEAAGIRTGDRLTPEAVRGAIQALYDAGSYGRIEVAAAAEDGGVGLTFIVEEPYLFATMRIDPPDLLARPLSSYVSLPYGQRYSRTEIDRIGEEAREQLSAEGYFNPRIEPVHVFDAATRLVTVEFRTTVAAPASIRAITFEGGQETFTEAELTDLFNVKPGVRYLRERLEEGAAAIAAAFAELGFLNTQVAFREVYDPAVNAADVMVEVTPGLFTLVQVRGFDLPEARLRELVPIFEEAAVDPELIEEGRVNLLEHLRRQGYSNALVRSELILAPLDNASQVNYLVTLGDRHEVGSIRIEGAAHFPPDQLYDRIGISSRGLFRRGVFSPELMEQAAQTITGMYGAAGFADTRVTPEFSIAGNVISVVLRVEEGVQLRIGPITFAGNTAVGDTELLVLGNMLPGQIYLPAAVQSARSAMTSRYYALGYPDARVQADIQRIAGEDAVALHYEVAEGERRQIGRILVAGATRTQEKVVHRNTNIFEGQPYNPEAILEAQRRLYATGLFNRVDIVPLARGRGPERDLLIQLEDAAPILLTYGVGVQDREGLRGTVELSHNNLWGLDRSLTFRLRGSRREQRFQATYREPRLFNWELDGFASLFLERLAPEQFDANRIDFSLQMLKQIRSRESVSFSASYQTVDIIRVTRFQDLPDEETGVVRIARLGASFLHDGRNDPINPSRGNYFSSSFQFANRALGSAVNFTSLFSQFSLYRPAKTSVIAAAVRVGWNQPYGDTRTLPITERYFAGGSTTLRAFDQDEAGPELGGNALVLLNAEYRFPIRLPLSGVGGALFYDTGTVFPRISDVSIGDFTHTAGFGLRYQTPLGPIRADYGINLNRVARPNGTMEPANNFVLTLGHTF